MPITHHLTRTLPAELSIALRQWAALTTAIHAPSTLPGIPSDMASCRKGRGRRPRTKILTGSFHSGIERNDFRSAGWWGGGLDVSGRVTGRWFHTERPVNLSGDASEDHVEHSNVPASSAASEEGTRQTLEESLNRPTVPTKTEHKISNITRTLSSSPLQGAPPSLTTLSSRIAPSPVATGTSTMASVAGVPGSETEAAKEEDDSVDPRVWSVALSSLLMGVAIGVIQPVMPLFAQQLHISTSQYGLILSSTFLFRLLTNLPAAQIGATYGRRPLLVGGPLITAAAMAYNGLARTSTDLLASRAALGVGGSAQITGAQLYLADISKRGNRARTLAPSSAGWSAGAVMGPALGGFLAESFSLSVPFFVVAFAIVGASVNNYFNLPETKPRTLPPGRVLREMAAENLAAAGSPSQQGSATPAAGPVKRSLTSQWLPLLRDPNVRAVLIYHMTLWITASGCIFTLMPLLATNVMGLSAGQLGGAFAAMSLVNVLGAHPAAIIADKYGRRATIVPAGLILSLSALTLPFVTDLAHFYGLVLVWAVGTTLNATSPTAYISDITNSYTRPQALALLRTAGDFGFMAGSAGCALIAEAYSSEAAMWGCAGMMLMATIQFWWRARESVKIVAKKSG
ncbi:MFS general substrate transporter [Gonapodya prolifera JEL478]|uniref:MFS general substrate transporter n=1 Tax=Gonapodya prolifera (strain JEL478) TaxID=1344416 RepID=A0A139A7F7_GONPJ|nr:MFS general substrate transporter [Gonapodya prolifera JEL478]|eukprot:KXS12741.1 MFS general substrate transporter [Gonapodya prolifera JEL478]